MTDVAAPRNETPPADPNAVAVTINGVPFAARKGELIIAAAERAGLYIPRFCYHPRMKPVGMCRQCLVEVDSGRGPAIMPSCMFPVTPDMKIDTESTTVKRIQEGVLELLLANHPLDCPVCDKGGECPLQDQAYTHGPGESRYVEAKRNFEKPILISANVLLDRERCILCDRCTRFADEVAGDRLIKFIGRGNQTEVNTFPDEPFTSYFSGNTVQICPVGALTGRPYRFKARPWDLTEVDSTCMTCAVGCRISVHSSRDHLLRFQGVDTGDGSVNWGWMCDRGRFNFEWVRSSERLAGPLVRGADGFEPISWGAAMATAKHLVEEATSIGVLGGARTTNEGALAWARLADALEIEYRDAQIGDGLPVEVLGLPQAGVDDAANAATVILLGPDIKEELPVLYLRLRDAAVHHGTRIVEFSSVTTGMSDHAWRSVRYLPGAGVAEIQRTLADADVAAQLATGDVVVVAGRGNLAESQSAAVASLRAVLDAVPGARVLPALRRGNVVGALRLGLAPVDAEHDATAMLRAAADGKLDLLVLLGSDPINDCPDADLARRALAGARRILSIDTFVSDSTQQADLVLAAAGFGEQDGTTTNFESRFSPVAQAVTAHGTSRPDWMIAAELALMFGRDVGFDTIESATASVETAMRHEFGSLPEGAAAEPAPNSYDYRLVVSRKLYDRAVLTTNSPSIAPLAVGAGAHVHPLDLDRVGVAAGTEVKLVGQRGSVVLPLIADEAVHRGTIWAPFNQPGADITDLVDAGATVTDVRIERL
jgi:NADH-quinone oxidoreductase subunit G